MKKLVCILLIAVLLCTNVSATFWSQVVFLTQPEAVLQNRIEHFLDDYIMFNDCDNLLEGEAEIVANPNSSKLTLASNTKNVMQGTASASFIKKQYNNCDIPMIVRSSTEVELSEYQYLEFDLYLSKNMKCASVPDVDSPYHKWYYGWIYFQSQWTNSISEHTISTYDLLWDLSELPSGAWSHFRIALPKNASGKCVQFTIHASDAIFKGNADEYLCIDNVRFTKAEGNRTLTIEDKPEVLSMKAAYDALNDTQKANIKKKNLSALNGWLTQMDQLVQDNVNQAVTAVEELLKQLPAAGEVSLSHQDQIQSARAAYEALSAKEKLAISSLSLLEQAEEALEKLLSQARIDRVSQLILELPNAEDITLDYLEQFEEANKAYTALDILERPFVKHVVKLEGIERKLIYLQATVEDRIGKVNQEIVAIISAGDSLNLQDVLDVFIAYDQLAVAEQQKIIHVKEMFKAARQVSVAGDVNDDVTIDATDALLVLQSAVGKRALTTWQQAVADLNEDSTLNAVDALMILRLAVQ